MLRLSRRTSLLLGATLTALTVSFSIGGQGISTARDAPDNAAGAAPAAAATPQVPATTRGVSTPVSNAAQKTNDAAVSGGTQATDSATTAAARAHNTIADAKSQASETATTLVDKAKSAVASAKAQATDTATAAVDKSKAVVADVKQGVQNAADDLKK